MVLSSQISAWWWRAKTAKNTAFGYIKEHHILATNLEPKEDLKTQSTFTAHYVVAPDRSACEAI